MDVSFDRINHQALLEKLKTFSVIRRAVKTWLKAKIMDGDELFPSEEGTPQGGVISPLLANIALHGLETAITTAFPKNVTIDGKEHGRYQPRVIRYADDFVVLHQDLKVVEKATSIAQEWLSGMGLELKLSKTRITHTFRKHEGHVGFDFLGFHVRQFTVGQCNYRTSGHSRIFRDEYGNLQLLHVHCHDEKTAIDETIDSIGPDSIDVNDYVIEEPCEVESLTHGSEDEAFGRPDVLV